MDLDLSGKNALVCGSSQGIGAACAQEIAALGANVCLLSRNGNSLAIVREALPQSGNQLHDCLVADFDNTDQLSSVVSSYLEDSKKNFHILVNNTGGPKGGAITQAENGEFEQAMRRHLLANHSLLKLLLPGMKAANYGRIVNVISTSVKQPIAGLGVSNTTRWAVAGWAKTVASEVAAWGITVNNVLPGFTNTSRLAQIISGRAARAKCTEQEVISKMKQLVPASRFGEAKEIAAAVAFLASPAASYINGVNLPVDGGRTQSL